MIHLGPAAQGLVMMIMMMMMMMMMMAMMMMMMIITTTMMMKKGSALACQCHSTDGRQQGGAWEAGSSSESLFPSSKLSSELLLPSSKSEDHRRGRWRRARGRRDCRGWRFA